MWLFFFLTVTWWRSWLRHCATSRKVAVSIPHGFIGIFHWHNPSGRTVALGLTQPLTEMSTRNISWVDKGGRCVGLTTLPPSCARLSWNLGASTSWNPQGLPRPVMGLLYLILKFIQLFQIWLKSDNNGHFYERIWTHLERYFSNAGWRQETFWQGFTVVQHQVSRYFCANLYLS